jgi:hypothetical protein
LTTGTADFSQFSAMSVRLAVAALLLIVVGAGTAAATLDSHIDAADISIELLLSKLEDAGMALHSVVSDALHAAGALRVPELPSPLTTAAAMPYLVTLPHDTKNTIIEILQVRQERWQADLQASYRGDGCLFLFFSRCPRSELPGAARGARGQGRRDCCLFFPAFFSAHSCHSHATRDDVAAHGRRCIWRHRG